MGEDTIFKAEKIGLIYTYPDDSADPEKEYQVGGFAAEVVLERCTDDSIVNIAVEFEKLRYTFQMIIGRRGLGHAVDKEASRYFQVGQLDRTQRSDSDVARRRAARQGAKTTRVPVEVPDFDLLD